MASAQPARPSSVDVTPEVLLRQALEGDRVAIRRLVDELAPVIRWALRSELLHRSHASFADTDLDDFTQEVWASLWARRARKLRSYDARRGASLTSFVAMISKRELIGILRKHGAKKRGVTRQCLAEPATLAQVSGAEPTPEQAVGEAAELATLRRWLASALPERGVAVFRCLYGDGLSPQQTADAIGVSTQVVYNWQHRIRNEVRLFFAERGALT